MTRDELLAKINKYLNDIALGRVWTTDIFIKALRSVVELHSPSDPTWDDGFVCCETCNYEYDRNEPYPCPTIQAIEKALG